MELVFVIDNGKTIGGGDYAQFKFAEHLAKRGHSVTVFAANRNEFVDDIPKNKNLSMHFRGELPPIIKGAGRINSLWNKIHTSLVVSSQIRSLNPDYVIGYLRSSAIKAVNLAQMHKAKSANFVFETPEWLKSQLGERFLKEYRGRFKRSWENTREAYKNSDILFANSNLTIAECSDWVGNKIDGPIYPGVELPDEMPSVDLQDQIIYVGRLNEYKNVDEIIKALAKVDIAPRLAIVGSGEEEQNLKELSRRLDVDCEFKGRLNDREKWREIRRSRFMVFPSSFEGFGMPPAESLASERPCICSDIPILREVYGDNVEYFREHDVTQLAQKVQELLDDPDYCDKRGRSGKRYVLGRYTWEKSAAKIEKLLENEG